ncbi:hypothetical protein SRHO_G00333860 [Serrasalmus rhombeus]
MVSEVRSGGRDRQRILKLGGEESQRGSGGLRKVGTGRYAGATLPDGASQPRARLFSEERHCRGWTAASSRDWMTAAGDRTTANVMVRATPPSLQRQQVSTCPVTMIADRYQVMLSAGGQSAASPGGPSGGGTREPGGPQSDSPSALRKGPSSSGPAAAVEREEAQKGRKTGSPRRRASHTVTALVDTGSTVSIIRPGTLRLLQENAVVEWDTTDTVLRSVTGERIKMGGKKRLCVGLAKRTLQHEFCLAPICDVCILGLDFLKALGAVLDIPAAALILGRTRVPLAALTTADQDHVAATSSVQDRDEGLAEPKQTQPEGEGVTLLPEKMPSQSTPEAVRELWRRSSEGLTEEQSRLLWALLQANLDVFAAREEDCTRTSLVQHQIDTGSTAPIRLRAHRLPIAKQQAAEQKLKEMAESGVIEPSNSPWAAPVVLVKKKDGSWRFCVDYRRLNAATEADSYPLPRIDDALDKVAGSSWFSSLDLRIPGDGIRASERRSHLRRPDGATFDEALACLEQVIGAIKAANLRLHPKKCHLLQRKVQFLGHVVSGDGVATDPRKVQSVRHWPTPRDASELRSFLGLASYYQRFIQGFADIAAPLHRLTEKGAALLAVVSGLKHFRHYLYGTPFVLRTDHASLTWLMQFKELEGQVARWITALQEFQFAIQHRAGRLHSNADAL